MCYEGDLNSHSPVQMFTWVMSTRRAVQTRATVQSFLFIVAVFILIVSLVLELSGKIKIVTCGRLSFNCNLIFNNNTELFNSAFFGE